MDLYPSIYASVPAAEAETYLQYLKNEIHSIMGAGWEANSDPMISRLNYDQRQRKRGLNAPCESGWQGGKPAVDLLCPFSLTLVEYCVMLGIVLVNVASLGRMRHRNTALGVINEVAPLFRHPKINLREAAIVAALSQMKLLEPHQIINTAWIILPLSADPNTCIRKHFFRYVQHQSEKYEHAAQVLPPDENDTVDAKIP
jgi:hypothetical protein